MMQFKYEIKDYLLFFVLIAVYSAGLIFIEGEVILKFISGLFFGSTVLLVITVYKLIKIVNSTRNSN